MKFKITISTLFFAFSSLILPIQPILAQEFKNTNNLNATVNVENNWEIISSESGLFRIEMPGIPEQESKTTEILGKTRNWELWQLLDQDDVYVVAYLQLSKEELSTASKGAFDSLKQTILEPLDLVGLDLDGRPIYLGPYLGREFIGIKSDKIVAIQIYLVGERLYGILVKSDNINTINQYFNSFRVEPFWESFISESGNFEIKLPEMPTEETETLQIGETELIWNLLRSTDLSLTETQQDKIENLYGVGYADLPDNWNQQNRENLLNTVGTSLLERLNLQLLSNNGKKIQYNNKSGLEFIGIKNGKIFALRLYEINNRVYALFTASSELIKVEKFFQSFQLF